eukprot:764545-Hanusia_phi.AAC.1
MFQSENLEPQMRKCTDGEQITIHPYEQTANAASEFNASALLSFQVHQETLIRSLTTFPAYCCICDDELKTNKAGHILLVRVAVEGGYDILSGEQCCVAVYCGCQGCFQSQADAQLLVRRRHSRAGKKIRGKNKDNEQKVRKLIRISLFYGSEVSIVRLLLQLTPESELHCTGKLTTIMQESLPDM